MKIITTELTANEKFQPSTISNVPNFSFQSCAKMSQKCAGNANHQNI
jgi:hypothetical protein